MKRLFVAIKVVPDDILLSTLETIKMELSGDVINWVDAGNLHITLKFLGDVPEQNIPSIIKSLQKARASSYPFGFFLKNAGYFGTTKDPKVLWIGIDDSSNTIERVYHLVQNNLENDGFKKEGHLFKPHLTIGRIKRSNHIQRIHGLQQKFAAIALQKVEVTSFELYESKLKTTGPVYTIVEKFMFTKTQ